MIKISTRWHYLVPPCLLSLFTFLVYLPSLRYPFVFDDLPNIANSYEIRSFTPWQLFFGNSRWIPRLFNQWTFLHWQLNPFAYRLEDLLLHILIGLIIFFTVYTLSMRSKNNIIASHALLFSTFSSGLFLVHPVQTQTATYITQMRLEGFATLFTWLTILLFTHASFAKSLRTKTLLYLLTATSMAFSTGTKEIIIVLPVLLVLIDWFFIAQADTTDFLNRSSIHLALLLVFFAALVYTKPISPTNIIKLNTAIPNNRGNMLTEKAGQLITPFGYLLTQFKAISHYFFMFFVPLGITFDYGWKIPPSFFSLNCFPYFLFLLSIISLALFLFIQDKKNIFSFAVLWFLVTVLPRSSIIPSSEMVCDYKTYMASGGLLIGIAYLMLLLFVQAKKISWPLSIREKTKISPNLFFAPLFFLILGIASASHNIVWSSAVAFWGDVIAKTEPHTQPRIYNNYAVSMVDEGKTEEGLKFYHKAIAADSTYAEPHINLALHYQIAGNHEKALEHYKMALQLNEAHPEMFNNLGMLHLERQSYAQAEQCFSMAVQLRPCYSKALYNLGRTYLAQKKMDLACEFLAKALKGDGPTIDFYYTHGIVCQALQRNHEAIESLEHIATINPNFKNISALLATCYYTTRQFAKAEKYFGLEIQKDPNNVLLCYNYAQTMLQQNKFAQALPYFLRCKSATAQLPHTPLHIAKCLHYSGNSAQAKKELAQFIQTTQVTELKYMGKQLLQEIDPRKS